MLNEQSYSRYKHSLKIAYHSLGLIDDVSDNALGFVKFSEIESLSVDDLLILMGKTVRDRIAKIGLSGECGMLDVFKKRVVYFNNKKIVIPLINNQGVEWYSDSSVFNFDFLVESFHGMHHGAKVIYDIGGHQGVWAAYYSLICGSEGRVYSFEPSIINFESSVLLFLINNINNVVSVPFGVGSETGVVKKQDSGVLVDFIDHNIGLLKLEHAFWERPDFIKIDIEGFEYELVKSFPSIFDYCKNIHLELHIPHLQRRGLDYRGVYDLIPFDRVTVFNYQHGQVKKVGPGEILDGYCSLLISLNED